MKKCNVKAFWGLWLFFLGSLETKTFTGASSGEPTASKHRSYLFVGLAASPRRCLSASSVYSSQICIITYIVYNREAVKSHLSDNLFDFLWWICHLAELFTMFWPDESNQMSSLFPFSVSGLKLLFIWGCKLAVQTSQRAREQAELILTCFCSWVVSSRKTLMWGPKSRTENGDVFLVERQRNVLLCVRWKERKRLRGRMGWLTHPEFFIQWESISELTDRRTD